MAVKSSRKQKKTWFNIVTQKEFGNYVIGETLTTDPQKLVGRNVKVNLMSVLNDPKKQNMQLTFKIKSIRDQNAVTEIISYELLPSYSKRLIRKGRNKIDDSFIAETKDQAKIRVKPVMITRTKAQRSKLASIRKEIRRLILEKVKTQTFPDLINEAISTKLQRELKENLKKIYPVAMLEFRAMNKV